MSKTNKVIKIFQLKAQKNSNNGTLKETGYIFKDDDFNDEPLEINGSSIVKLQEHISVKFSKSNLTSEYMLTNKKLPVMCASVMYQKPFVTGTLMNLVVYFEITDDTTQIKSFMQLLNTSLNGTYTTEISLDKEKDVLAMPKFTGYHNTAENIVLLLKTEIMESIINEQLNKRDEERRERLGTPGNFTIPVVKYNFDDLVKRYDSGEKLEDIMK